MTRPAHSFALRLAAASAAAVTLLPGLPAAADEDDRVAPPVRPIVNACPADRVDGASFADAAASVHRDSISCLSWYGIAQGAADGTYGADRVVTRAQLATFLVKVLDVADVDLPDAVEDAFSDDNGNAHEANLDVLAALGILSGTGAGTVDPNAPVERAQMATLLVRVLEIAAAEELGEALKDYFDDDEASVHAAAINLLAELGVAAGRADGRFDPTADVLREQMATFVMRLIDRLVEDGDVRVPATLVLSAERAAPGDVVDATVLGDDIASVALVGCGLDGAVTDGDAADGVQFTITVPSATAPETAPVTTASDEGSAPESEEDCELVVVVTFTDGSTQEIEADLERVDDEVPADEGASDENGPDTGTAPPADERGTAPVEQPAAPAAP